MLNSNLKVGTILTVSFGYTHQQALIFAVPMGAIGLCVVLLNGFLSDKVRESTLRFPLMCLHRIATINDHTVEAF